MPQERAHHRERFSRRAGGAFFLIRWDGSQSELNQTLKMNPQRVRKSCVCVCECSAGALCARLSSCREHRAQQLPGTAPQEPRELLRESPCTTDVGSLSSLLFKNGTFNLPLKKSIQITCYPFLKKFVFLSYC